MVKWHGYQLILPTDLVEDTMTSLAKTAMVSRVTLQQNDSYKVYGFYLSNPHDLIPDGLPLPQASYGINSNESMCVYSIADNFYLILITSEKASALYEPFSKKNQFLGSLEWHYLQLNHLQVNIYPETRGLFLPHRLDLQKTGYISFDKGCYKGQEIIARTHYLAKLKHGLKKFIISTMEPLSAGKKLFNPSNNTEVGELIDFCPLSKNDYLILTSIINEHPVSILMEGHLTPIVLNM